MQINTGQGPYRYEVVASIEHIGMQLQSGHYISYVNRDNIWYECNDERITPLGPESEAPTRKAYILLLKMKESLWSIKHAQLICAFQEWFFFWMR